MRRQFLIFTIVSFPYSYQPLFLPLTSPAATLYPTPLNNISFSNTHSITIFLFLAPFLLYLHILSSCDSVHASNQQRLFNHIRNSVANLRHYLSIGRYSKAPHYPVYPFLCCPYYDLALAEPAPSPWHKTTLRPHRNNHTSHYQHPARST